MRKSKLIDYNHQRDKHPTRKKHYGEHGWKERSTNNILKRNYSNYQEYIEHQKEKWNEMLKSKGGIDNITIIKYRLKFFRRFSILPSMLDNNAVILCLGARQGTEVEVLRDIGFNNAYGLDLNPGVDNPWVFPGDFMNLKEKNNSIDFVYSNAIDHVFDIDIFLQECARVLKFDGMFLCDCTTSEHKGAFESIEWENEKVILLKTLNYFHRVISIDSETGWTRILLQKVKNKSIN